MDQDRRLKQDIYFCSYTKVFNDRKHVPHIERHIYEVYNKLFGFEHPKESLECDYEMSERFDRFPIITFTDKIMNFLPIKHDNPEKKFITVYKLKKGSQIPEGFSVKFDEYLHVNIYPTEKVKCKYYFFFRNNTYIRNNCITFNDITDLDWELHGYIDIQKITDCAEWFIEKHKDDMHQGKGFETNFMEYIESVYDISDDVVNCIDAMFFPFLTKIENVDHKFVYKFLYKIFLDYIGYCDFFDMNADWEIGTMMISTEEEINKLTQK